MKKIYTLFAALIFTGSLMAQTPQSFKYQAVARDAGGDVVADQAVGMQISILQGSITGTAMYVETFTPTTNGFGLITLNIGAGTVVNGDLATIDWSSDTYFIKIEMDMTGGTTYEEYGTSQLLSVPYALHAKTAENVTGTVTETDPLFTAWDKSAGISITESQISDLDHFTNTDETDQIFTASVANNIDASDTTRWGSTDGTETDPVFGAHAANGITSSNITNWTTAYGWGDHSTVGYTTTDTTLNEAEVDAFVDNNGYLTNETDPVFGAHIVNGITLTDTANWNAAYGWGDHSILGYFATGGESGGTNRNLGNTDDYSLGFKTNDATRLFITNDGNVGIGITSPLTKLHVMETGVPNFARLIIQSTDDGAGIRLKSDVGYHCYLDFSDGDSDYVGRIYYSHNDDQMRFRTAGSDAMTINSAGSVGIGTTSPGAKLDVSGTVKIRGNYIYLNDGGPDGDQYIYFYEGGSGTGASLRWDNSATRFRFNKTVAFDGYAVCYNSLYSYGPITYLGTSDAHYIRAQGKFTGSRVHVGTTGTEDYANAEGDLYVQDALEVDGNVYLGDETADTTFISGNIGIGTTDPKSKLHVVGLPEYTNNTTAVAAGLTVGAFYRTGDYLKVVH